LNLVEILLGAGWYLAYAVAVFTFVRSLPALSPAVLSVVGAMLFTAAAFPVASALPVEANFWRVLVVFCFLVICHLMVFGAVYKSISLRMMLDLLTVPGRRLATDEVFSRYIQGESFEARTQVMIAQGLATPSAAGFSLTAKGRRVARTAQVLQQAFDIDTSG